MRNIEEKPLNKTQVLVDIIKEKTAQIHLNKEYDDITDSVKFHIKKRVKKIMDKPIYFDILKYIRESVVYEVDNILIPPTPQRTFFESYSDMCNYRFENDEDNEIDEISLNSLP